MVIATVIAVPLGLAVGASRVGARLSRPVIDFLRPIPSVALIPILILLYGSQPEVKVPGRQGWLAVAAHFARATAPSAWWWLGHGSPPDLANYGEAPSTGRDRHEPSVQR